MTSLVNNQMEEHTHKPEIFFSWSGNSYAEFCRLCGVRLGEYNQVIV